MKPKPSPVDAALEALREVYRTDAVARLYAEAEEQARAKLRRLLKKMTNEQQAEYMRRSAAIDGVAVSVTRILRTAGTHDLKATNTVKGA